MKTVIRLGFLFSFFANATTYTIAEYSRSMNVQGCPLARFALKTWRQKPEAPRAIDHLRELSTYDGTQVKVVLDRPSEIHLKNMFLQTPLIQLPTAKVTASSGQFDESGRLLSKTSITLMVQFNLLGICPFVSGTSASKEDVVRAVENILEVRPM